MNKQTPRLGVYLVLFAGGDRERDREAERLGGEPDRERDLERLKETKKLLRDARSLS